MPTFTMRMPEEEHEALAALALLTQRTMAELVREAVVEHISAYASSDEAQERFDEEQRRREGALAQLRAHDSTFKAAGRIKTKVGGPRK